MGAVHAMKPLKASLGKRLVETRILNDAQIRRLRLVSITTVDELLGAIRADPEAVSSFIGLEDLSHLQADAAHYANQAIYAVADELEEHPPAMGAEPPEGVSIEGIASAETFEHYSEELESNPSAGEPPALNKDLRYLFGPIRHQGRRGTCVGHACAAVLEGLWSQHHGNVVDLSPQYVFYDAKRLDGKPQLDGTWAEFAMPTLIEPGVCEERFWPYEGDARPGDVTHGPPPQPANDDAPNHRVARVEKVPNRQSAEIKTKLDQGRPVEISVPVYQNWYTDPATAITGVIPMPLPTSPLKGGHAMCAVGYGFDDDVVGGWYFLLRNSWGTGWAEGSAIEPGYGAIPFVYIDNYGWEAFTASF